MVFRIAQISGTRENVLTTQCPYCLARQHPWPSIGTSILFLNRWDAGEVGVVVPDQWGTCPSDRFLVKMSYAKDDSLRLVMPSHDLFLDIKRFSVPLWMPPLSIEDNAILHESLMSSLAGLSINRNLTTVREALVPIIERCWRRRFPLNGRDIWPLLEAHGVKANLRTYLIDSFDYGIELLTWANGRVAVRRRRMPAMSKGHYHTKMQAEIQTLLRGGRES